MHQEEVEIDGQRHCPQYGAEGEVVGEERLHPAQVLHVEMARRVYTVHVSVFVALNGVEPVEVDGDPHQIGDGDAAVGHGEVHQYLPHFRPQFLEADVGEDDKDGAQERRRTTGPRDRADIDALLVNRVGAAVIHPP